MDDFTAAVTEARGHYPECSDGGGEDHYRALVALGQCPYCGADAAPEEYDIGPENAPGAGAPS